ncbi:hypothetical protein D3C85_860520 [compost metagenome]
MFGQALCECLKPFIVRGEGKGAAVTGHVHKVVKLFDALIRGEQIGVLKGLGVGRTEPGQEVVIAHGHVMTVLAVLGGVDITILE